MKKVYQKPEFEVICQNQANAKFFVASFESVNQGTQQSPQPTPDPTEVPGVTTSSASSYGNDQTGFNF